MANLTPLIQKGVKDTTGNYSLAAVVCGGGCGGSTLLELTEGTA